MAGSPNAFAKVPSAQMPRSSVLTEQDHNVRARKRPRLSEEAVASFQTQCVQPDTSLEADHMILDYIAYQTINACFASRRLVSPNSSLSSNLAMSDAFLSIFKARHPTYQPDAELRLRILLLRLTTLLTQRLTSNPTTPSHAALLCLRAANTTRARAWIGRSGFVPSLNFDSAAMDAELPLPFNQIEQHRAKVLHELGVPPEDEDYEDAFYGTSSCVSLLDILPLFMELSAARNAMNSGNITEIWMRLACEFMLQACLEQYLVFGAQGTDALDEAFFWAYIDAQDDSMEVDGECTERLGMSIDEINAMFEDEDYETQVEIWTDMKMSYIEQLFQPTSTEAPVNNHQTDKMDIAARIENVSSNHPISTFESTLLNFLEALMKSIPDPVLIQLENGKLDGMTEQQTQDFLTHCGIDVANLFDHPSQLRSAVD